jgi:ribonuclease HI
MDGYDTWFGAGSRWDAVALKHVDAYTDGACITNPGPGGYGVVLKHGTGRRELSAGYRHTTNNRMEILAAIAALQALMVTCQVTLYSDSQYLVRMMQDGWPQRWRASGWRRKGGTALNPDLWEILLQLCDKHRVAFVWVRGHAGHPENERCDRLAVQAAQQPDLLIDEGYERPHQQRRAMEPLL